MDTSEREYLIGLAEKVIGAAYELTRNWRVRAFTFTLFAFIRVDLRLIKMQQT
jgi:hypothetical protein